MEVRAAIVGQRDELPVELETIRQAAAELRQQMGHIPAAPAPSSKAGVRADQATKAVQLRLEHPAAAVRDRPSPGEHRFRQPQSHAP